MKLLLDLQVSSNQLEEGSSRHVTCREQETDIIDVKKYLICFQEWTYYN